MIEVRVPHTDVNSDEARVVAWKVEDHAFVRAGEALAELETSKAIFEVTAPADGFVRFSCAVGDAAAPGEAIALLFSRREDLAVDASTPPPAPPPGRVDDGVRATDAARARAAALGIDLSTFGASRLVTLRMVEAAQPSTAMPLEGKAGCERVLIIGGGRGATQVIDIFESGEAQQAVGILDDGRDKWGETVDDVPVLGGTDRLEALFAAGAFDAAIIAISTSVAVRARFRARCAALGVPLTNAIDPTCKVARRAVIGVGNVLCAFCHIGTSTVVGDNNFLSAYNSFDHHNVLGNDISTGPGVLTSSRVKIGDRCRLGTGIHIQPGVELGEGVRVASGAVLVDSVPAGHAVKTSVVTSKVVPDAP